MLKFQVNQLADLRRDFSFSLIIALAVLYFQGCEWLTSPAVQHTDDPESSLLAQPLLHRQADHNIYEGAHKDGERTPDTDNN